MDSQPPPAMPTDATSPVALPKPLPPPAPPPRPRRRRKIAIGAAIAGVVAICANLLGIPDHIFNLYKHVKSVAHSADVAGSASPSAMPVRSWPSQKPKAEPAPPVDPSAKPETPVVPPVAPNRARQHRAGPEVYEVVEESCSQQLRAKKRDDLSIKCRKAFSRADARATNREKRFARYLAPDTSRASSYAAVH